MFSERIMNNYIFKKLVGLDKCEKKICKNLEELCLKIFMFIGWLCKMLMLVE